MPGNAAPSLLAEVLAISIRSQLLGCRETNTLKLFRLHSRALRAASKFPVPQSLYMLIGNHLAYPGKGKEPEKVKKTRTRKNGERASIRAALTLLLLDGAIHGAR
jgi:DNA (cytosine-5)-methyltransferase 1